MKNSSRTFLQRAAIAVLAASAMMLSGCSSGPSAGASASASSSAGNIVTVNNVEPAAGLIPSNTDDLAGWKVVTQLYEGLVTFDAAGKLVYADATSITPNADASEYTIKLRSGLVFSDGEKITASTYAKSWSFAANAANGQLGAAIFSTIKGYDALQDENGDKNAQLSGLKVVDDTTLDVTLAAPDSSFPYKVGDVAFLPLPASAYKDIDTFGEHPVGNGPYKLASWSHDKEIKLVPNPRYTGPRKAKNRGVTYELYTSLDAAYSDLLAGNLDVLDSIPSSALKTYSKEQLQTVSKPGPGFKSFTIPQNMAHFSGEEGKLRRAAIAHAVDRETIIKKVLYGTATKATDFTAPTIAGYSKILAGTSVLDYDAAQAKKLWKQADDISPWEGTFRLAYSTDSGNKPWIDAICNSITNALGIDAQPLIFSTSKELSTAIHNRTVGAAFIQGLQSDYPHPEGYLVQAYDSASADGKGLNNGDYKSAAFDALIDQAARQTTLDGAVGYYHKAEELLFEDLPVIPLWYTNVTAAAGKQVGSLSFNYMGLPDYYKLTVKG
ncbi:ABC transporter substrate-binding protein [Bifidobacterium thermacidophilum]|uniref:ABC transporter substrate-binding protein n=1 Tax=Bifidobacterium thermacidophilum TaxID=246618 RepID=A0ABW8KM09_9BIFI